MSDDVTREEFEALKERVAELESGRSTRATSDTPGLDHRDEAVLNALRRGDGEPSGPQVVELYKRYTDITNHNTAKQRARQLQKRAVYEEAVDE